MSDKQAQVEPIESILRSAGYIASVGMVDVLAAIVAASDGSTAKLCSGFGVFPDGERCNGCADCEARKGATA